MGTARIQRADLLTIRSDERPQLIDITARLRSRIRNANLGNGRARLTSMHQSLALVVTRTRSALIGSERLASSVTLDVTAGDLALDGEAAVVAAVLDGPKCRGLRLEFLASDDSNRPLLSLIRR